MRNIYPPSSGFKSKLSKKSALNFACCLVHSGFFLGLLFNFEELGDVDFQRTELWFKIGTMAGSCECGVELSGRWGIC
jgi:hypothetical protein